MNGLKQLFAPLVALKDEEAMERVQRDEDHEGFAELVRRWQPHRLTMKIPTPLIAGLALMLVARDDARGEGDNPARKALDNAKAQLRDNPKNAKRGQPDQNPPRPRGDNAWLFGQQG